MIDPPGPLADLWRQVPDVPCKGLCQDACANIACSLTERELIWLRTGTVLPDPFEHGLTGPCPLLTPDGRCSDHDARPLICRLYGAAQSLPCPHGCTPTFGHLPDTIARDLLTRAEHLTPETR